MANLNFNKIFLGGRLTADPELKTLQTGTVICNFTIAVTRQFSKGENKDTDFFNCIAFGKTAELIQKYFVKGSSIFVTGSVQNRSYEKDGQKRYISETLIDAVNFVDSLGGSNYTTQTQTNANTAPNAPTNTFTEVLTDEEDLPF